MKLFIRSMQAALLCLLCYCAFAQSPSAPQHTIEPYHLDITLLKTTNLVFPFPVASVDKGSKSILAQKAKGAGNILQVKAAEEDFEETNLTVVTTDGKLYSYLVNYSSHPGDLNLVYGKKQTQVAQLSAPEQNEAAILETATAVAEAGAGAIQLSDENYGVSLELAGLYIKDDVFYYQLKLTNRSYVPYDIDQLRFFIRDRKRAKRTAAQELEQVPLYVHGNTSKVEGHAESLLVVALPKQTIPDKKYLALQVMEASGGRHLSLKIKNKTLVAALPWEGQ